MRQFKTIADPRYQWKQYRKLYLFFRGCEKEAVITDITAPGVIFKQRKINNGRFVMC